MEALRRLGVFVQSIRYRLVLSIMIFVFSAGCYYDNEVALYPGDCIANNITYHGYVKPFIDINCTCHVKGSINGNLNLEEYGATRAAVLSGKLMQSIKHESGTSPMPPAVPKRNSCDISKLEAWINAGALNN
ncbi:MAG: hypothetical protein ABI761_05990 [Saprospiraceae bacterium]